MADERDSGDTFTEAKDLIPVNKSLLNLLRERLRNNPSVYFIGELHNFPSLEPDNWTEMVELFVAPKEPLFNADELNSFRNELFPDLKPSLDFEIKGYSGGIELGHFGFDEAIGKVTKVTIRFIESDETDAIKSAGGVVGESKYMSAGKLLRRNSIRLYPDVVSAMTVYAYKTGIQNGTVEPDWVFHSLDYKLNLEQLDALREYMQRQKLRTKLASAV